MPKPFDGKLSNPKDAVGIRKVAFSVLPWRVLYRIALGMMEGAAKYGRHNYRGVGVRASVYFDATVARHIGPWWEGEDIDPESGEHHLDKAMTSLMVLRDSMLQGNFVDDRPPYCGGLDLPALNERAGVILDRHADKSPHHWTIDDIPSNEHKARNDLLPRHPQEIEEADLRCLRGEDAQPLPGWDARRLVLGPETGPMDGVQVAAAGSG